MCHTHGTRSGSSRESVALCTAGRRLRERCSTVHYSIQNFLCRQSKPWTVHYTATPHSWLYDKLWGLATFQGKRCRKGKNTLRITAIYGTVVIGLQNVCQSQKRFVLRRKITVMSSGWSVTDTVRGYTQILMIVSKQSKHFGLVSRIMRRPCKQHKLPDAPFPPQGKFPEKVSSQLWFCHTVL